MRTNWTWWAAVSLVLAAGVGTPRWAAGNGGPFLVKYPGGDPAAKGVLARLDPTLKPTQETRLRVVKEDLGIHFGREPFRGAVADPPLVGVSAVYTIENPTAEEVQVDFGFPILRGIYMSPFAMIPTPDVQIRVDKDYVRPAVISNSAIYGLIRKNAREGIEKGIANNQGLAERVAAVRQAWTVPPAAAPRTQQAAPAVQTPVKRPAAPPPVPVRSPTAAYLPACESLRDYLTAGLGWNARDAALMVAYASLDFGPSPGLLIGPRDRWDRGSWIKGEFDAVKLANLGPLAAIGEQKATQLFAQLASRFDEKAGSNYEAIFAAWGGDVRERSLDLATGEIRPREITLPAPAAAKPGANAPTSPTIPDRRLTADPTVYARIDYLDPNAKLSPADKASCEAVLKNLPVTFTFAPMNLLHYQVKFPGHATRVVAVTYRQYAYADTQGTGSYQLAYVLHPATLWQDFGPIHLAVVAPKGILCRASAAMREGQGEPTGLPADPFVGPRDPRTPTEFYQATLESPEEKRGELFVAVEKAAWDAMFPPAKLKAAAPPPAPPPAAVAPSPPRPLAPPAGADDPFG
ncbi:MAG: hypothetical protein ABSG86_00755 [Thermoguttaceae bacterium]|jgi:hypothetical protein